jgi:tetratricopeptide (TPR) repeat protein
MFNFFKSRQKGTKDNGTEGRRAEKSQTSAQPQGPWARAEALMAQGQGAEALEHYARTLHQTQDLSHMDMAERWLKDPSLLDQVGEAAVCRLVSVVTIAADGLEERRRWKLLEQCLDVLRRIEVSEPRPDLSDRYAAESNLLRRMGRPEEGLEAAKRGVQEHNSPSNYAFAAVCCLALDDPEQAEKYIRGGRALVPGNLSTTNDLADYYLEHGNFVEAARCYQEVVEESADSDDLEWAEPSLIYCRWRESGDPMELERLALCAASRPRSQRGAQLCQAASAAQGESSKH